MVSNKVNGISYHLVKLMLTYESNFQAMLTMLINRQDRKEVTLISDPIVQAIEVKENGEPLFDLSKQTAIRFGNPPHTSDNRNYTLVRTSVYYKLLEAQTFLLPNLKLCLYEGYRSLGLQHSLFIQNYNYMANLYQGQDYSREFIFNETTKLVSPVYNINGSKNLPPHSTGGAFDIYLIDQFDKKVDMGIDLDEQSNNKRELAKTDSEIISEKAIYHRNIMSRALSQVGFVNYATEYWHWSYGDKYWAYHTKQKYAIYGGIE